MSDSELSCYYKSDPAPSFSKCEMLERVYDLEILKGCDPAKVDNWTERICGCTEAVSEITSITPRLNS